MCDIGQRLLLLCGPSGSGKTTLVRQLLSQRPSLAEAVSHTTRPIREGEVEGEDYHFVTREQYKTLEFAESVQYHDHWYGIAKQTLTHLVEQDKDIVAIVDSQGLEVLSQLYPQAVAVLVLAPSLGVLEERLRKRGDEVATIERRLATARREMSLCIQRADHIILNTSSTSNDPHAILLSIHDNRHSR